MAAVTYEDTVSDGSQVNYNLIFSNNYISRDHVEVKFNGTAQPSSSFTFNSDTQIKLVTAAPNGTTVRVGRNTPQTVQTDFPAAVLPEADLDNGYLQMLYHVQELQDYFNESVVGNSTAPEAPANNWTAIVPPTVNDDTTGGYTVGSKWFDSVGITTYICSDNTDGAAVWNVIGLKSTVSATAPGITNDSSDGYSVGSHWWDTATGIIYTCTDATEGAAVWGNLAPSSISYPLTHTGLVHDAESGSLSAGATIDLSTATGNWITVTGDTTVTDFTNLPAGSTVDLYFTGSPLITAHATKIICPLNLDIQVQPGDVMRLRSEGTASVRVVGYQRFAIPAGTPYPPRYMFGFVLSNGTDSVNDIDIGVGACVDTLSLTNMLQTSVFTKQIDAVWAEGSAAGGFPSGLTSGTPQNTTWYHVFVIRRGDTGLLDYGFDTSLTAANLLADATNYSSYRRIGSIYYATGTIAQFVSYAGADASVRTLWNGSTPTGNVTVTSTPQNITLQVPTGISTLAHFAVHAAFPATGDRSSVRFYPTDIADETVVNSGVFTVANQNNSGYDGDSQCSVIADTNAQIRVAGSAAGGTTTYISPEGFTDFRGD